MKKQERIFVIGHKNPDTDSICSAIAYADIKNRTTQSKRYIPKRAGQINEEICAEPFWCTAAGLSGKYRNTGQGYGYPSQSPGRQKHVTEKYLGSDAGERNRIPSDP